MHISQIFQMLTATKIIWSVSVTTYLEKTSPFLEFVVELSGLTKPWFPPMSQYMIPTSLGLELPIQCVGHLVNKDSYGYILSLGVDGLFSLRQSYKAGNYPPAN